MGGVVTGTYNGVKIPVEVGGVLLLHHRPFKPLRALDQKITTCTHRAVLEYLYAGGARN